MVTDALTSAHLSWRHCASPPSGEPNPVALAISFDGFEGLIGASVIPWVYFIGRSNHSLRPLFFH